MKSIQSKDLDLNKKKVLIRLDLNVPISGTKIIDTNRIDKVIPTLNFLIKSNASVITVLPLIFLLIAVYAVSNLALRENMDEFKNSLSQIKSIDNIK